MCGISGCASWGDPRGVSHDVIDGMIKAIECRGPDGKGIWRRDNVALGHARLAIIDLAGGAQPMATQKISGREVCITFSGEIYNYRQLRDELVNRGHQFRTKSDTEVLLNAYLEWGEDSVHHLVGMFAYAVWDTREDKLVLVRDRVGVKPLHYYVLPDGGVVFGSEIKALLAHPQVPAALDTDGVAQLFCLAPNSLPGSSILKDIHELPPGHTATVTRGGIRQRQYWRLESRPHTDTLEQTVDRVRELITQAVREQLHADVPVGSLLSGGLDSSLVAALAARERGGTGPALATYAIDYQDEGGVSYGSSSLHADRDTPWAEAVAAHIKADHTTYYVNTQDLIHAHEETLAAMDLPSYSPLTVSLLLLFRRVRQHVPVVLSGEAADELFGGYHWYHDAPDGTSPGFPWMRSYQPLTHLLNPAMRSAIRPERFLEQQYEHARKGVPHLDGEGPDDRRFRETRWLTNQFYLRWLLHRKDRLSMASGVEARVPFCDHRLMEYAWNIPREMHNADGIEKSVLRRAAAHILPHDVAWRKKSGYPAALTGEYQTYIRNRMRDIIATPQSKLWDIVDPKAAKDMTNLLKPGASISDWTALMHTSYLIEMEEWITRHGPGMAAS